MREGNPSFSVPYVPTPHPVVEFMLSLAGVGPEDILYDLGCGDGRIPITAVKKFGVKKAVCVEIRRDLYEKALSNVKLEGLEDRVEVIHGDMFDVDLSEATVVTLFLLMSVNRLLRPKLEKELKNGTRVVSHEFEIPGWEPLTVERFWDGVMPHKIYLYVIKKERSG